MHHLQLQIHLATLRSSYLALVMSGSVHTARRVQIMYSRCSIQVKMKRWRWLLVVNIFTAVETWNYGNETSKVTQTLRYV